MGEHALDFERGIALFNEGRYFDAHEEWERLWLLAEEDSPPRLFVQGLIMISSALDHYAKNELRGTEKLLPEALDRLTSYRNIGRELIDMDDLLDRIRKFHERFIAVGEGIGKDEFPTIKKL